MREIKLRAWDENKKEMVQEEQLVFWNGNIYRNESGTLNDPEKPHKPARLNGYSVMRDKIMQYTGLKDKNGKEICESDILDFGMARCVVKYNPPSFAAYNSENHEWNIQYTGCEVIGNIYENP
jgi:uncharacterized phage protein (TIGR01671 family)